MCMTRAIHQGGTIAPPAVTLLVDQRHRLPRERADKHLAVRLHHGLVEEQAGNFPIIEKGVPDMNPLGYQKGACWSHMWRR